LAAEPGHGSQLWQGFRQIQMQMQLQMPEQVAGPPLHSSYQRQGVSIAITMLIARSGREMG
jgi:primosomal replication protein N